MAEIDSFKSALPKSIEELSHVAYKDKVKIFSALELANSGSTEALKDLIESTKKQNKEATKTIEAFKAIKKAAEEIYGVNSKIAKILKEEINNSVKSTSLSYKAWNSDLNITKDLMKSISKNASDMYKTSHEMQLQSNITWKEYSLLYNEAFKSARAFRAETGKSLFVAKELIAAQNALLGTGWKGISMSSLNNIASSVAIMQRTLGTVPQELTIAFQKSYRQFGEQTNSFVTAIGNRLNAFSDTFGISIGMLSGAVSQMMASNSFIARNNMQAQIAANESLMKATALSSLIGLDSSNFISSLARTSQFGTMQQMQGIFEGGALLQDFDTAGFQEQMINQNYEGATQSLFSSIYNTLNGIEDHYVRAEYMNRIGSSFGLSQDELLQIATNGGNLEEYSEDVQSKLLDVNTSMVDEIKELRISVADRLTNWWENTQISQGFGKAMQDLGLIGVDGHLRYISAVLTKIAAGNSLNGIGGLLSKQLTVPGGASANSLSVMSPLGAGTAKGAPLGVGLAGLAVGTAGNMLGGSMISGNTGNDVATNIGGWASNVGSGLAGGAMVGSMFGPIGTGIGAGIGAGVGIINSFMAEQQKNSAIKELEDSRREQRAATYTATNDPVVDAINANFANLINMLNNNHIDTKRLTVTYNKFLKTTTDASR